jgi:hypothetical protein
MHLITMRPTAFEQHPWIAMNLYKMSTRPSAAASAGSPTSPARAFRCDGERRSQKRSWRPWPGSLSLWHRGQPADARSILLLKRPPTGCDIRRSSTAVATSSTCCVWKAARSLKIGSNAGRITAAIPTMPHIANANEAVEEPGCRIRYFFSMESRCLISLSSSSVCCAIRSAFRASSPAPEYAAACSTSCRMLSRTMAMCLSSSDRESELSLLIVFSPGQVLKMPVGAARIGPGRWHTCDDGKSRRKISGRLRLRWCPVCGART